MPKRNAHPKTWGSFLGATLAAAVVIAVWFPVRLIAEILKTADLSEKPDHRREAPALFREAYTLSRDLPSRNDFAESVLSQVTLPHSMHTALFEALRGLYAGNMMLDVPPIPDDLNGLDGIRWRDRLRTEIARIKSGSLGKMRSACLATVKSAHRCPSQDCR